MPERLPASLSRTSPRPTSSRPAGVAQLGALRAGRGQRRALPEREAEGPGELGVAPRLVERGLGLAAELMDHAQEVARHREAEERPQALGLLHGRADLAQRRVGPAQPPEDPGAHDPGEDALVVADAEGDDLEVAAAVVGERRREVLERLLPGAAVEQHEPHRPVAAQAGEARSGRVRDLELPAGERDRLVEVPVVGLLNREAVERRRQLVGVADLLAQLDRPVPHGSQAVGGIALEPHQRVAQQDLEPHLAPVALGARLDIGHQLDPAAVVGGGLGERRGAGRAPAGGLEALRRALRLSPERQVVTDQLRLGGEALRELPLHDRGDAAMELQPALAQQRLVGGVADQGVPELIAAAVDRGAVLEDPGGREPPQLPAQAVRWELGRRGEQPLGEAASEHGGDLGDVAGAAEPVEPGEQRALQRGRQAAPVVVVRARDQLLHEQRHAVGPFRHPIGQLGVHAAGRGERARERSGLLRAEPVEREVNVAGEARLALETPRHDQQHRRLGQPALEQAHQLERRGVAPMQVLRGHDHRSLAWPAPRASSAAPPSAHGGTARGRASPPSRGPGAPRSTARRRPGRRGAQRGSGGAAHPARR